MNYRRRQRAHASKPSTPGSIHTISGLFFFKFFEKTTFNQYLLRILVNFLLNFKFWTKNGPSPFQFSFSTPVVKGLNNKLLYIMYKNKCQYGAIEPLIFI